METLKIKPFKTAVRASVSLPGSKSITNRALILAAASGSGCEISGALFSRDTEIMMSALKALGFDVCADAEAKTIAVSGRLENGLSAEIFVGNAGTAARFLTALAAASEGGVFAFDSDAEMYARPMGGLIQALEELGAEFEFSGEKNHFPFVMRTHGLRGGAVEVDAGASSQILSAVMMASKLAKTPLEIRCGATVSAPFVKMTEEMMRAFPTSKYAVEPDATAASYFAALPAVVGGVCALENFAACRLQGDAKFLDVLESAGLVRTLKSGNDVLVFGADTFITTPLELDFNDISDTFLTLAAVAAFLPRTLKITGIKHTRKQETDRVAAMASQLKKLAARVVEGEDFLEITSFAAEQKCTDRRGILQCLAKSLPQTVKIETFNDHRIAMSFGILGCADLGREWIEIENPQCTSKTWREFFGVLAGVGAASEKFRIVAVDGGAAVGKSSVSKAASAALGYMHVDTGAHYRNLAYILLEDGITPAETERVRARLQTLSLSTAVEGFDAKVCCNGKILLESDIRCERINANVSVFAAIPEVREFLKNYQRSMAEFARKNGFGGLIMEGRDIGSVIFPDADARIFLDADEATRAARRAKEGITDSIGRRDELDRKRKVAPLVCPDGATRIDTSHMSKDEVVAESILCILNS